MAALAVVLLPGIGSSDPRLGADTTRPPWTAIARLNVPGASRCTAVLVAPSFAATAAHCLTRRGLGHFVPPGSVHLLLGYRGGSYARHIVPDAIILPRGADPDRTTPGVEDVALLHFAPPATGVLPPDPVPVAPGTSLSLAGFNQDRMEQLDVDSTCHALGYAAGFLRHSCAGTRGTSGGAVLAGNAETGFRLVGIQEAANAGAGGLAVPAAALIPLLPAP